MFLVFVFFFLFYTFSAEETEDDEVSATVLNAKVTSTFSDQVPALTDKTFDAVRKDNDLLVVDFFQPCKLEMTRFNEIKHVVLNKTEEMRENNFSCQFRHKPASLLSFFLQMILS